MKALKEKRIGFRSLLRRGLVILSLFALIFAVGCGGNEATTPTPDPDEGGEGGTPPIDTPTKTVKSIYVLSGPSNVSFQGLAPDLTGLTARVTWNDNTTEVMTADKFTAIPPYCDDFSWTLSTSTPPATPNDVAVPTAPGAYMIAVDGYTGGITGITLPGVVPLKTTTATAVGYMESLSLTGSVTKKLYTDQVPDFSELTLYGNYQDYTDGSLKTDVRKPILITADYPRILGIDTYGTSKNKNYLVLALGYKTAAHGTTAGTAGTAGNDPNDWTQYNHYVNFNISGITKIDGISVASGSTFPKLYDDSLALVDGTSDAIVDLIQTGEDGDETSVINLDIVYQDGETRTISFDDYIANLDVYNGRQLKTGGKPVSAVFGSDGKNAIGREGQINWDYADDEVGAPVFNVIMNYVPSIWGDPQQHAGVDVWVDQFVLTVPVFTFDQEVELRRKEGAPANNVVTTKPVNDNTNSSKRIGVNASVVGTSNQGKNLLTGINTRYEAVAYFSDGGTNRVERVMDLTAEMFARGIGVTAPTSPATTWDTGTTMIFELGGEASIIPAGAAWVENFVLPLVYRGQNIVDMEEGLGVLINLAPFKTPTP